MSKRALILLWPLFLAPLAALAVAEFSGPTYTEAPNQAAMAIRGFGLLAWIFVASLGSVITLLLYKPKVKTEWLLSASAAVLSVLLFFAIKTSIG